MCWEPGPGQMCACSWQAHLLSRGQGSGLTLPLSHLWVTLRVCVSRVSVFLSVSFYASVSLYLSFLINLCFSGSVAVSLCLVGFSMSLPLSLSLSVRLSLSLSLSVCLSFLPFRIQTAWVDVPVVHSLGLVIFSFVTSGLTVALAPAREGEVTRGHWQWDLGQQGPQETRIKGPGCRAARSHKALYCPHVDTRLVVPECPPPLSNGTGQGRSTQTSGWHVATIPPKPFHKCAVWAGVEDPQTEGGRDTERHTERGQS